MRPTPPSAHGWVGWCRLSDALRRVWQIVAEAPTERECWAKVYAVMDRRRGGARDWCVLPSGEKP